MATTTDSEMEARALESVMILSAPPVAGDFLRRRGSDDWYRVKNIETADDGRPLASVEPYTVADSRRVLPGDMYHPLDEAFAPGCLKAEDESTLYPWKLLRL